MLGFNLKNGFNNKLLIKFFFKISVSKSLINSFIVKKNNLFNKKNLQMKMILRKQIVIFLNQTKWFFHMYN
jgi:hypothetical protein